MTTSYPPVVLPSIHEMFPEHLMPRPTPASRPSPRRQTRTAAHPPPPAAPSFSFDVLKSDPRGSSLTHIASSRPTRAAAAAAAPRPVARSPGARPLSRGSSGSSEDGEMDVDEDDAADGEPGTSGVGEEGKKHVCPTCSKRFNRPSSLRIHVNTHTGATPFRCPHPSCGRAFNVNSNMRRHFRNHAVAAAAAAHAHSPSSSASSSPISPTSPSSFSLSLSPSPRSAYSSPPTSAYHSPASTSAHYDAPWIRAAPVPMPLPNAIPLPPHPPPYPVRTSQAKLPAQMQMGAWGGAAAPPGPSFGLYSESDVRSERR